MSPKTRFQMFIEPEQLAALRKREAETGAAVAEQIRRAIDMWLKASPAATKAASRRVIKTHRKA
jgi:hypothetical protein